jgi:uridine phosphorylase
MVIMQIFTKTSKGDVSTHALVTSLEEVYERALSYLNNVVERTGRPGFRVATGEFHRTRLTVVLHPIGPSALAILLEELARLGTDVVLYLDAATALSPKVDIGSVILATGAIKGDGVSKAYAPLEVPAIPSHELFHHVQQSLEVHDIKTVPGIVWSVDTFYLNGGAIEASMKTYSRLAVAMDMGTATLFTVAMTRKLQAASVLVVESSVPKGVERGAIYSEEEEYETLHQKIFSVIDRLVKPLLEALSLHMEHVKVSKAATQIEATTP